MNNLTPRIAAAFLMLAFTTNTIAQVGIGIPTAQIHPSAKLEVSSTTQGFLPPRMTESERNAIASPAAGLMVFCTNCGQGGEWQGFNGSQWRSLASTPVVAEAAVIGTQVWATKNLDVATYRDGTPIPEITTNAAWAALTTGAWCWYDNDSATYAATYGRLYNWYAVAGIWNEASNMDVAQRKQLAPAGYHIPTDLEWTALADALGGDFSAGGALKETGTTHWACPNFGATNSSGFTGLPGGTRYSTGSFSDDPFIGSVYWSSVQGSTRDLNSTVGFFGSNLNIDSKFGFSVRCLRD